jgi:hypothetical protein
MSFYEQFFGNFMPSERKQIADRAGLSLPYILKHCYVNDKQPKFHFHNAVALDKASNGVLRFWEHSEGDVDWEFVLIRLREAKRNGLLGSQKNAQKPADVVALDTAA